MQTPSITDTGSHRRDTLLITSRQAQLLLELVHKAAWTGATVVEIAPVIAQLETLAPPAPPSSIGVDSGNRGI